MKALQKMPKQKAVYWGSPVSDGMGGYTYDTPVEISVRWDDKAVLFIGPAGDEMTSRSVILVTGLTLVIGGYLRLGTLGSVGGETATDPRAFYDAFIIKQVANSPSMRANLDQKRIYL